MATQKPRIVFYVDKSLLQKINKATYETPTYKGNRGEMVRHAVKFFLEHQAHSDTERERKAAA